MVNLLTDTSKCSCSHEEQREERECQIPLVDFFCMHVLERIQIHTHTTGVHFMCKYKSKHVLVCLFCSIFLCIYQVSEHSPSKLLAMCICVCVCARMHAVLCIHWQPLFTRLCAQDDKWTKITLQPSGVTCDRLMKRFIVPNTCALCRGKPFWHILSHSLLH